MRISDWRSDVCSSDLPGQLEQVIINLAVNARDAMPGGGTLTMETFPVSAADVRQMGNEFMPPADYCALKVSDTGTGIPAEVLPKIFEPFFTTKEDRKSTRLNSSHSCASRLPSSALKKRSPSLQ